MTRPRPRPQRRVRLDRRKVALALALVLVVLVAMVVVGPHWFGAAPSAAPQACAPTGPAVTVRGIVGSEKGAFFADKRVLDRFACAGLDVTVELAGSRDMVTRLAQDNAGFGFAFPGSTATAEKLEQERKPTGTFTPFSSPMAVATFAPIVKVLTAAGIVVPSSDGSSLVDVAKLIDVARKGTGWNELPGNSDFEVAKDVLLSTTDPLDSNSAIMFLSIASQVANGGAVVTSSEQVQKVLPDLCRLIFYQGQKPETSQVLFNYYLVDGIGRIPMGLIYESQFLTQAPGQKPVLTPDRVMLYPKPTVYSRHTVVALDAAGDRVGEALTKDPELARFAAEYGFHPANPEIQPANSRKPPLDVVESPSYDVLERMIDALAPTPQNEGRCVQ